jgi:DNA-binding SARP family transcriptional activator
MSKNPSLAESMTPLFLSLFGDVSLVRGAGGDIPLPRKTQILLAYLASNPDRQVSREKLAGLVWPDRLEEQARHSLRQCLFTLTRSLGDTGPPLIHADRQHISLNNDCIEVDTWQFERLLKEDTVDTMERAVDLYGGDFLSALSVDNEELDTWCAAERTRLRELCYEASVKLSSHYADTARIDDAIVFGRRLVALDPLQEGGHRILMRLYGRAGRRADALNQFRQCRDLLRNELGVEPEATTIQLHQEIKGTKQDPEPTYAATGEELPEPPAENENQPVLNSPFAGRPGFILAIGVFVFVVFAAAMLGLNVGRSG